MIAGKFRALAQTMTGALGALALLASEGAALTPVQNTGKVAIRAGRIVTMAGPDIEDGVIVIENGRITAIGKGEDVQVPWDAPVLDASDQVAFPGFVEAHSNSGMDRGNESIEIAPFLSIEDSIDPVNFYFQDCLRSGITTINVQHGNSCVIGAQGMIVRPTGLTVDQMTVRPRSGLKISLASNGRSRATQAQTLRGAFSGLRHYLEDLVQQKKDGNDFSRREALAQGRDLEGENGKGRAMSSKAWTVEGFEMVPRGEVDEKQAPLLGLVEGKYDAWIGCAAPMDVARAIEVATDNGFLHRTRLVIGANCWKAADQIAAAGCPVVLVGSMISTERDPWTGEETEVFVPAILKEKGIEFALASRNSTTQSLRTQAAMAIGYGMTREEALQAVTTVPANLLGLSKSVGSLEVGKDGNVVLFDGDPLSVTSRVQHVVIEGAEIYDRAKDVRAEHLQTGEGPSGTTAIDAEPEPEPEGDGEGDDEDEDDGDQ